MSQGRRHFTDEFKREAVALVRPTLADRTAYAARFLAPGRSRAAFSPARLEQQDLPPFRPFAVPIGIGSVGWIADFRWFVRQSVSRIP
jgi:hypothetical protein